ncbi:hypothetical protein [Streptomyces sp. NPDC046197]
MTSVEYAVFGTWGSRLGSHGERVTELDPAMWTGWTYAGDGGQIQ